MCVCVYVEKCRVSIDTKNFRKPFSFLGSRFARMSVKIGLIHALKNFSYQISPKMKFTLEFDKNLGLLTPCNSILPLLHYNIRENYPRMTIRQIKEYIFSIEVNFFSIENPR